MRMSILNTATTEQMGCGSISFFVCFLLNELNSKKILLVKQALSLYTKEKISKEDLHNEKY